MQIFSFKALCQQTHWIHSRDFYKPILMTWQEAVCRQINSYRPPQCVRSLVESQVRGCILAQANALPLTLSNSNWGTHLRACCIFLCDSQCKMPLKIQISFLASESYDVLSKFKIIPWINIRLKQWYWSVSGQDLITCNYHDITCDFTLWYT
jgi:hypothetical protein